MQHFNHSRLHYIRRSATLDSTMRKTLGLLCLSSHINAGSYITLHAALHYMSANRQTRHHLSMHTLCSIQTLQLTTLNHRLHSTHYTMLLASLFTVHPSP